MAARPATPARPAPALTATRPAAPVYGLTGVVAAGWTGLVQAPVPEAAPAGLLEEETGATGEVAVLEQEVAVLVQMGTETVQPEPQLVMVTVAEAEAV